MFFKSLLGEARFRDALLLVCLSAVLIRLLVGLHPYSGQGNPPKYGDYEAQRHWMEVTVNFPVQDWYRNTTQNDLGHWGLDYPPLTAYQSYLHGLFMRQLDPESMALITSRGYESPQSKVLMRWTVLLSDVLIFFPAALAFVFSNYHRRRHSELGWLLAIILFQPGLVLIDHGHFQYNCISLGLAIGAATAVLSRCEILACFLFCLSLNHKQMSMYYAPAFFAHLLGVSLKKKHPVFNILKLGLAVVATFTICWSPFLHSKESVLQVFRRLVPIHRGIFEDYVGNFWCVSNLVIKWKLLFSAAALLKLALAATVLAVLPSMVQQIRSPDKKGFLLAMLNSSLAFYLFSYQVHEKSILLAVVPATLLALEEPDIWKWLVPTSLMSMFPLLLRDGLLVPYFTLLVLHWLLFDRPWLSNIALGLLLHLAYLFLDPPDRYPFLFEALISSYTFIHFVAIAAYANYRQWFVQEKLKGS